MSSSGSGEQGCPLFHVVHPAFPLLNTASPILQGSLKDSLGEAVVACDMPESCKFPSLDSCQKRFLRTHKEVELAPHPVVGLVHRVGNTEKFPQALGFESLDLLFRISRQSPCSTAIEEDGRRIVHKHTHTHTPVSYTHLTLPTITKV